VVARIFESRPDVFGYGNCLDYSYLYGGEI
jgi:hypothetical protein